MDFLVQARSEFSVTVMTHLIYLFNWLVMQQGYGYSSSLREFISESTWQKKSVSVSCDHATTLRSLKQPDKQRNLHSDLYFDNLDTDLLFCIFSVTYRSIHVICFVRHWNESIIIFSSTECACCRMQVMHVSLPCQHLAAMDINPEIQPQKALNCFDIAKYILYTLPLLGLYLFSPPTLFFCLIYCSEKLSSLVTEGL